MSLRLADAPHSTRMVFSGSDAMCKERLGTCLWVGDHRSRWTGELFERCTAAYAQVAVRTDLADAIERGCQGVSRILVLRIHSGEIDRSAIERLVQRHPSARWMEIRGPMAEAFYRFADPLFHDGHQRWNVAGSVLGLEPQPTAKSVLVVAPDLGTAAPLIQAAASGGITATWTRHPHPESVCGIQEMWWHDAGSFSAGPFSAGPCSAETPLSPARARFPNVSHVGIQTGPAPLDRHSGFDRVVVFPGELGSLIGNTPAPGTQINTGDSVIAGDSRRVA